MGGNVPSLDGWEIYVDSGAPIVGIGEVHLYIKNIELWRIICDIGPSEIPVEETHAAVKFPLQLLWEVHVILNVPGQESRHGLFQSLDGGLFQSDLHTRVHVALESSLGLQALSEVSKRADGDNTQ